MDARSTLVIIFLAALLAGCGGGSNDVPVRQQAAQLRSGSGQCGYEHVYVTVRQVQIHARGGWTDLALPSPRRIDLADENAGVLQALGLPLLEPGHYTALRLTLAGSDGGRLPMANAIQPSGAALQPLSTPGAQEAGLLLQHAFDVPPGQVADVIVQGCLPVTRAGGARYMLRPNIDVQPRVAAAAPVGEFRINSITPIAAEQPYSTQLAGGGFVVMWQSGEQVWYRVFTDKAVPLDVEQRVTAPTADGRAMRPGLAPLADGGFVITWTWVTAGGADGNIYLQRYSAEGVPAGPLVRANSDASNWQDFSGAAGLADGSVVVTWERWNSLGRSAIWARRFASSGTPLGDEFRVNLESVWPQSDAKPIAVGSGFIVTWDGADTTSPTGNTYGMYFQRFTGACEPVGGAVLVNVTTAGSQESGVPAVLAGGGFVVAWTGMDQHGGSSADVYARRFDASGAPLGGEFRVNTSIAGDQTWASVTGLVDGGFVIAWMSLSLADGRSEIDFQRFDSGGAAVGPQLRANTTVTGRPLEPSTNSLADGGFVVIWRHMYEGGMGLIQDILAQRYAASGAAQ